MLDQRRRKRVAVETKEGSLAKLSAFHIVQKSAPVSCVRRSTEGEALLAGSAGSALRRMLSVQELSKSGTSKPGLSKRPLRSSSNTSFARATQEPLAASPSKRKSLTRSSSEVSGTSSAPFAKPAELLSASSSTRKPLAHSNSEASQKAWATLRSSLKRVQETPKAPGRREPAASEVDCSSSRLDARKIGLSRLMYKYARRHHETRSSFQARSEGTAERHPGPILREAMTDIRLAVRTVGHLNRFLELLEERRKENIDSRSLSSASTSCQDDDASTSMRLDSKDSRCSAESVETDISSADDAWNNLLSALQDDSDQD